MIPSGDTRVSTTTSTVGGVMTEEAGAVTGDLEIMTHLQGNTLDVSVRYVGAEESYTVSGSPVVIEAGTPEELHSRIVEHLSRPGPVTEGNEAAISLEDLGAR